MPHTTCRRISTAFGHTQQVSLCSTLCRLPFYFMFSLLCKILTDAQTQPFDTLDSDFPDVSISTSEQPVQSWRFWRCSVNELIATLAQRFQRFGERECVPASPLYGRLAIKEKSFRIGTVSPRRGDRRSLGGGGSAGQPVSFVEVRCIWYTLHMQRTIRIKLEPSPTQAAALAEPAASLRPCSTLSVPMAGSTTRRMVLSCTARCTTRSKPTIPPW